MSSSELLSHDPCTGEVVWSGTIASPAEVDAAAGRARAAFAAWASRSFEERAQVARRFAELVKERREEIATLLSRETGKPLWEARTEADSTAGKIAISIRAHEERTGESESETGGVRTAIRHKPHGVMAVIGPFNFPLHLPNGHIAPALLAGDVVLFKPSEKTPACGVKLVELWREAGAPEGVVQVLPGLGQTGQALVGHEGVDGVLFTGGVTAGRAIHQALADHPNKIVALELGGNNPMIVWDVADADAAAHLIVQSAYVSAGQRCSCARRLIVQDGPAGDRVLEALGTVIDRIRVGAPFEDPAPFMGPVIDEASAGQLTSAWDALVTAGGKPIRPLRRLDEERPLLSPALIDVTGVERRDEEMFGPILQVIRAADFETAMQQANATRFGLAAALVGGDEALYRRFWSGSRAGVVNWNRPTTGASSAAPFGGVGLSGNHRPSAYYAADYCAYPVASLEAAEPTFRIETGLN
jgi:succinylglutamic semialdehyde dehydrogenase